MTKEDLKEIVMAFQESQKSENDRGKIVDWLFKALIAVIVWIGIGLRKDVDVLKGDVSRMATEKSYSQRDIDAFKEFVKTPRFTEQDYENHIGPTLTKQERIESTQKDIVTDIEELKEEIREIKYKMRTP